MTPEQRSRALSRVKLKNGPLERLVQSELRALGLCFRCHDQSLPGSPDIVFPKSRVAVFVDGDFWHGWRLPAWEHKLSRFWRDKLHANRDRDRRNFRRLQAKGWKVIRIWQHELEQDDTKHLERILRALRGKNKRRNVISGHIVIGA